MRPSDAASRRVRTERHHIEIVLQKVMQSRFKCSRGAVFPEEVTFGRHRRKFLKVLGSLVAADMFFASLPLFPGMPYHRDTPHQNAPSPGARPLNGQVVDFR